MGSRRVNSRKALLCFSEVRCPRAHLLIHKHDRNSALSKVMPVEGIRGMPGFLDRLKFNEAGLIAVIVQVRDVHSCTRMSKCILFWDVKSCWKMQDGHAVHGNLTMNATMLSTWALSCLSALLMATIWSICRISFHLGIFVFPRKTP
jgi:hypothetical protein